MTSPLTAQQVFNLSNEFKHADRNSPSSLAQKMMLKVIFDANDITFDERKMISMPTSSGALIAIPWIERSTAGNDYFIDVGERAIAWWDAFALAGARSLDKDGNPA